MARWWDERDNARAAYRRQVRDWWNSYSLPVSEEGDDGSEGHQ